ncbi:hypothetical protein HYH02_011643 [Chlamydomonas schloesseri]|uniref:non-specific serine/threonine protein kinase n=1 Tax=Chlamydomonas schloesseri TaxID=2026947 RepID=A0A835W1S7_9CHLO|nr:hypothetical protein HYH02_011643 [Chlamydomonas schloesseri]|eukprot:KAG2436135.1 hypothetical protein HYH02_011643 [Chlamydomonas schloesseri]
MDDLALLSRSGQAPGPGHFGQPGRSRAAPKRASVAGEAVIYEEQELQHPYPGVERSSSAEHRATHAAVRLASVPQAWDRCNSADGVDPAVAKQLATAVESKLKLAPLLAKRLERVSHSSGSFSSRSVTIVNSGQPVPSGRNTPQRRISGADYNKLNYLVTSLEGARGDRGLKVEGSARLPQVGFKETGGSPTTSKNGAANNHNFEEAKRQVDRDLRLFLEDVRDLYAQISLREGADVPIVLEVIASIMDIAEECLETPIEDFKLTITDIVDNIEEERSACQQRTIRALYTRLLFILTRCSRLLITEQQHLFATEPRNRRRHSQVFGPGFTTKTQKELGLHLPTAPQQQTSDTAGSTPKEEEEEPVFRSHTMPVKTMITMAQRLKQERPLDSGGWAEPPQLARIESEQLPESPAGPVGPVSASGQLELNTLRHQSQSSDLEGFGGASDSSMTSASKKKKSLFNKISKGIKNFVADGFKRKVKEGLKDAPDGLQRPQSEMGPAGHQQPLRFRIGSDPPRATDSPGGSRRGTKTGVSDGNLDGNPPAPTRKLDQQRSVRFQETPVTIIGENDDSASRRPPERDRTSGSCSAGGGHAHAHAHPHPHSHSGASLSTGGGTGAAPLSPDADADADLDLENGKRAKLMVNTEGPHTPPPTEPGGMGMDPSERTSASPQPSSELGARGTGRAKPFRRASVDLFALGHMMPPGTEPMSPDGAAPPDDLSVICSICEEAWLSTHLEEHSIHCAVLRTLSGNGLSIDAQLTTIANVLEEWLETPLAFPALGPAPNVFHVKNQLMKLIKAARNAAALQPDGSKVPTTRCFSIQAELGEMLETAEQAGKLAVVTQTYAHRVMRLISEKVNLLAETGGPRQRAQGGSDAGDSGTSTPRSMPGMSIEEFEIIKPISRGAFGRVYLARKLATGDLFAIKVMKKRDLIRKNMVESVTNERNILAMAQNPFVVRFYYSFTSRENLYIVMEYINGGDCYSLMRKFGALDEEVARQYIAETVLALEYCHAQGIIHRDLKPDNLLINAQGHVKLTDFGLSCVGVIDRTDNLNGSQPMDTDGPEHEGPDSTWGPSAEGNGDAMDASGPRPTDDGPISNISLDGALQSGSQHGGANGRMSVPGQALGGAASSLGLPPRPVGQHQRIVAPEHESRRAVGTPDYLAPELLLSTGHGPEVDWWALGAILYEFITGAPPFNADTPEEIFDNILDRRITWPDEDDMSCDCRDLIDKLLHPNPLKRLGHRGAGEVKLHPWFEGLDWTGLVRNKAAFIPAVEDETDTSYFESKHVSQRSMAEDLDKLRTSVAGGSERSSAQVGPCSGPAQLGVGPSSGPPGGRTQVDRLKDAYYREGSGLRSVGSSNSHGSSHMSRTSYTGQAGPVASGGQMMQCGPDLTSLDAATVSRMCSSPSHAIHAHMHSSGPESATMPHGGSYGGPRHSGNVVSVASGSLHPRNSVGSSSGVAPLLLGGVGARNSGSGGRNSGSGARNSGSGARGSASGSAGAGGMSERPSPGSIGTGAGGTMSGLNTCGGTGEGTDVGSMRGAGMYEEEAEDGYPDDEDYVGEEGVEVEVEEHNGEDNGAGLGDGGGPNSGRPRAGVLLDEPTAGTVSGSGDEEGIDLSHDPFNNFSFTNFTGLSAANMEKIQKLREHFNRRTSYSGPDQGG